MVFRWLTASLFIPNLSSQLESCLVFSRLPSHCRLFKQRILPSSLSLNHPFSTRPSFHSPLKMSDNKQPAIPESQIKKNPHVSSRELSNLPYFLIAHTVRPTLLRFKHPVQHSKQKPNGSILRIPILVGK